MQSFQQKHYKTHDLQGFFFSVHIRNHKNTYLLPLLESRICHMSSTHQFWQHQHLQEKPSERREISRPTFKCELSAEFSAFSWTATLNTAWQVYLGPYAKAAKISTCTKLHQIAVCLLWFWSSLFRKTSRFPNAAHEHIKHCRHLGLVSRKAQHANLQICSGLKAR